MKSLRRLLRKGFQNIGLDIHRYRHEPEPLQQLSGLHIGTILDVGANVGQFASEARRCFPDAHIYSFEPVPTCFHRLMSTMGDDERFHAFNVALGQLSEKREIYVNKYSPSSSLLPMNSLHKEAFPHTRDTNKAIVAVKTLDSLRNEINFRGRLLVKMDVQGFERDVILGGKETFSRAHAVVSEVSFGELYMGQPLFHDISSLLENLGFFYAGSLGQKKDPRNGQVLIQDALFLRH